MSEEIRCEHCGGACNDEDELDIMHRGCRFRAAFPDAYTQHGPLLEFDVKKIAERLKAHKG